MVQLEIPGVLIREELGRGSYSVVYRAEREGRNYAVKVPLRAMARDETVVRTFAREATILACLHHPNIARIRAAGHTADHPFLIMDLIEGDSLKARIAAGPLGIAEAIRVALDVASALSEAHRRGLVHQDVKPANIMIGSDGKATLLDFGLMTRAGGPPTDRAVGTVLFGAPEQTGMLRRPIEPRSDLYALGAVLHTCLAGSPPFQAADTAELLRMHAVATPRPLTQVRADVPAELAAVVTRLLAKDPDDRYQSALDVVAALTPLAPGAPTAAHPTAAHPTVDRAAVTGAGDPDMLVRGRHVGRRREGALLRQAWTRCLAGERGPTGERSPTGERGPTGECGVVTVIGEAGAGKTLLIQDLLAAHGPVDGPVQGPLILRGRCAANGSAPLALLHDLIDGYLRGLPAVPEPRRRDLVARMVSAAGPDAALLARVHPLLARVLEVDRTAGEPEAGEPRLRSAAVGFLSRLALRCHGLVIWVDDAHWLGPADRQILEDLTASTDPAPLLLINSTRDPALRVAAGSATSWEITLGPLREHEVAEVIRDYLGEITDHAFARDVAVRSSGNPLAVVEYVRAVIDAGLVRPDWGRFVLDRTGLDSLPLPDEVLDLIRHRVHALNPTAAAVLGVAAVIGRGFDLALLTAASGQTSAAISMATAEAQAHQLAARGRDGTWSFVHDCVHEALLSTMSPQERLAAHRRVVDVLDDLGANDLGPNGDGPNGDVANGDGHLYELARHAIAGRIAPDRRFRLTSTAAAAALATPAPYEAVALFRAAQTAADEAGLEPDAEFEEGFALACARTLAPADARTHFTRALRSQADPRRRARALLELAGVEFAEFRTAAALEYVHRGLAEIGRGLPANPAAMAAVSMGRWAAGMACRRRWTGFGAARGEGRELHEIRCRLYEIGILSEWLSGRIGPMLAFMMAAVHPTQRLGSGEEYLRSHGCFVLVAADFRRARVVERGVSRLRDLVADSEDPVLRAEAYLYTSAALLFLGRNVAGERDSEDTFRRAHRWIETFFFTSSYSILVRSLALRGHDREAWARCEARPHADRVQADLAILRARLARTLRYPPVPHPGLGALDGEPETERIRRYLICSDVAELEIEDDDFGPTFDAAIAVGDDVVQPSWRVPGFFRQFWVTRARGRLEQARAAPPGPVRTQRHRAARRALRAARQAAAYPPFAADLRVLRAVDRQLAGDHGGALDLLDAAERAARTLDLPRVRFDALLERARCLRALDEPERATTEAELAAKLAARYGWIGREHKVYREFELTERGLSFAEASGAASPATASRDRRRLDAVLQVSAAAGRETTPESVATVALDEIISILGADRALLLLPDPADRQRDSGRLRLYAERHAEQTDDLEPDEGPREGPREGPDGQPHDGPRGIAMTVVERVQAEQRPLVVTGTDEGAALGSQSAVQYGLRSILAAPVPVDGGRSGVIYVDSRVAKGLFDSDDARILITLAKQVGLSLNMAEAARLQAVVAAERRQRDLAETMRNVTLQATSTLNTREILGRVLTAAGHLLPFDVAWVLTRVAGTVRISSTHGEVADGVVGTELRLAADGPIARAFDCGELVATADAMDLPGGGQTARSWLAAPVPLRESIEMVVVLASRTPDCYSETRIQIAQTMIDQVVIGYQNAWLFEKVQRLAATDQLTGLASRRHFLERADHVFAAHGAADRPVNAAMIDIDHFKRVNDAHGHFVGDEVLTEVAQRIRRAFRDEDLIGRVGGEEFAVLMSGPVTTAEALGQRLRDALAQTPIETSVGPLDIRLSVGLAPRSPGDASLRDLLARADAALYEAKHGGRDRVAVQIR
ncbi:diguanylate cyclase [Frankia sp. AiPs1]|uniref:diguanylate cyclase n=1 Tax=Frankia sp. AiPs1 TaxID=573493 RepID=UPI002043F981|nr:diguanylate cyclase [Frankia sp. AiPs1]MCM3921197.1 diguanylate cyclase [Frankia sp. AiPs1]